MSFTYGLLAKNVAPGAFERVTSLSGRPVLAIDRFAASAPGSDHSTGFPRASVAPLASREGVTMRRWALASKYTDHRYDGETLKRAWSPSIDPSPVPRRTRAVIARAPFEPYLT